MILVTVGTHFLGFDRLVRAADELANEIDERVVVQYGCSSYIPRCAEGFAWTSSQQMEQLTQEARVVVTHAAAGAIILALKNGKPLVVTPRKKLYNEHIDDHQRQLCEVLAAAGRAVSIEDPSPMALKTAIEHVGQSFTLSEMSTQLEQAVRERLSEWERAG